MEDEISCDDPQFMNMMETCLRVEIDTAKNTVSDLESKIKEFKYKIRKQLEARKELKEKTKNTQENSLIITTALNKQSKHMNEISEKIELMKHNLDNDYKIMKMEHDQFANIYNQYEKTWQEYHVKYEEFPLAKIRKQSRTELEKLRIDKMVLEYKINELDKARRLNQHVTWLRMRGKIVEFARAISNGLRLDKTLEELNSSIQNCKEELIVADAELAALAKRREEEKRNRAVKMLEMPPPRIKISHIRSIYGRVPKTGIADGWKRNYENSIDSLSVDTLMLEEMCQAEENTVQLPDDALDRHEISSPDQEERDEATSETEGNGGQGRIQQEMAQEPLEELPSTSAVFKDKQTVQRSEERADGQDDPLPKRIKLIPDEQKASPVTQSRILRPEKKRSQLVDPNSGPRIARIEAVRYNVSPRNKSEHGSLNSVRTIGLVVPGSSQLSHTSPEVRKLDQDNPSSMFTPRHYDYFDNSEMSFCVDNNTSLKGDQISLDDESVRDFCQCSNISIPVEGAEMAMDEDNTSISSTSKKQSFPQFDFSNIMKPSTSRNDLF